MMLNMVLNVVLNLVLNSISSLNPKWVPRFKEHPLKEHSCKLKTDEIIYSKS